MLLLRFQMCAVVNHLHHRKSRMPRVANPECRNPSHGRAKSVGDNIAHSHIRKRHHDRRWNAASPKRCSSPSTPPPEIRNAACRHNHRRPKSFEGNLTYSRIRRRRHHRYSTRIETRHRQSDTTDRIRRHETASFKHPSIRCYRSSSRYQVTPHRTSCPCLVSFSVGHYDVLVSTPDSMFSVV